MLLICPTPCWSHIRRRSFKEDQDVHSAGKWLLLGVWVRKGPKTQFSGQIYKTLFSRTCSMNCVCFPAQFFWLVLQSLKNNVLSNDESNYAMHNILWVDNGRFFFKKRQSKQEITIRIKRSMILPF